MIETFRLGNNTKHFVFAKIKDIKKSLTVADAKRGFEGSPLSEYYLISHFKCRLNASKKF